jgi:hypothetical protein
MRRDDGSESSNARPLLGAGLPRSERDSQHHPTGVPAVEAEARDVVEVAAARGCCARVSSRPRPPNGRSTSSCETATPRCSSSTTSSTCHGSSRGRCASTYARSILRRCAASLGLHQGGPRRLLVPAVAAVTITSHVGPFLNTLRFRPRMQRAHDPRLRTRPGVLPAVLRLRRPGGARAGEDQAHRALHRVATAGARQRQDDGQAAPELPARILALLAARGGDDAPSDTPWPGDN